ncbi:MAG: hypothetical protein IPJ77_04445 [Planctomycetes bacterium]|nr:hypothetical protein [Planctomycetota bacterium]
MNRSIALFVALAILLAHILAIHNDGSGGLAFPYDQAHAAYRLARNLVMDGQLQWNPGSTAFESYSSPVWIAVCTIGERLCATRLNANLDWLSINLFCQTIGVLAMLTCVVLAAQFREERIASLIAPLMLVSSGCIAAAAANGLETALFTLFVVATFLAFERGRSGTTALFALLLCLTRPEGVLFVLGLLALRPFARKAVVGTETRTRAAWPLFLGLAGFGATCGLRFLTTGAVLPPSFHAVLHPEPLQFGGGLEYLLDFVRTCPAVLLVLQPIALLSLRRLSGLGARALLLGLLWLAFVALQGRAPLPFCELCVPALPFLGIAIQEGLIEAFDAASRFRRRVALTVFAVGLVASALPSREPADLGPLPLERIQNAWLAPSGSGRFGYAQPLGRTGLEEEIERTHLLRGVGLFLRDHVDPSTSVLTPWPGAVGYLARGAVYDLGARASAIGRNDRAFPWSRRSRIDVVEALQSEPGFDLVVPLLGVPERVPTPEELALKWRDELDASPAATGRKEAIQRQLERFELVTVPVVVDSRSRTAVREEHFLLLRRRDLGLAPRVAVEREGEEFVVRIAHKTHHQLADLRVTCVDDRGRTWWMRPTGELTERGPVSARRELLLYDTGTRRVDALRARVPELAEGARVVEVRAWLVNPDAREDQSFAVVGETASSTW